MKITMKESIQKYLSTIKTDKEIALNSELLLNNLLTKIKESLEKTGEANL